MPDAAPAPRSEGSIPDLDALSTLEDEIRNIAGHLHAGTARFLDLIAAYDRAEGWGVHGVASCAQWLNLYYGIGPNAAREKVRVARALEHLPRIRAAFRDGQVSYSKVRAMTRVATPQTEAILLNVALYGTASHVERLVRCYRRVARFEAAEAAHEQHRNRSLNFRTEDDGMVSIHGRLSPEVGALIRQAVEVASARLEEASPADVRLYAPRRHSYRAQWPWHRTPPRSCRERPRSRAGRRSRRSPGVATFQRRHRRPESAAQRRGSAPAGMAWRADGL